MPSCSASTRRRRFKPSINDTDGHGAGDDLLCAGAQAMVSDVRLFDRVFRIGGEEFAVILSGADAPVARSTAERLRRAVAAERIVVRGRELSATVSIGVAMAREDSDPVALVEAADAALYRAKKDGRNRVVVNGGTNDPVEPQPVNAS